MTKELTNRLADLAERIRDANSASEAAALTSIEKAFDAGRLLIQAKSECRHGEWSPFLDRAGIHERQARRLMQLARSGLTSDTVSEIGGFKAALDWLSRAALPEPDEVIFITAEGHRDAVMTILPSEEQGHFDVVATNEQGTYFFTKKPVPGEPVCLDSGIYVNVLWMTVRQACSIPVGEWQFDAAPIHLLLDDCAFLADQVELPKGKNAPLPESYKAMIDTLEACAKDFTPDRYFKARRAQKLCLVQMEEWPSDPRMFDTFARIANDKRGTNLARRVDELMREKLSAGEEVVA